MPTLFLIESWQLQGVFSYQIKRRHRSFKEIVLLGKQVAILKTS